MCPSVQTVRDGINWCRRGPTKIVKSNWSILVVTSYTAPPEILTWNLLPYIADSNIWIPISNLSRLLTTPRGTSKPYRLIVKVHRTSETQTDQSGFTQHLRDRKTMRLVKALERNWLGPAMFTGAYWRLGRIILQDSIRLVLRPGKRRVIWARLVGEKVLTRWSLTNVEYCIPWSSI